jgi:hypothetical protein
LFNEKTRGKKDFLFLNMETEAITENKVGFLDSQPPVFLVGESQWNPFIASKSWPQGADIGNIAQSSCFVELIDCLPNRRNKQRAGFLILGSICTLLN